MFLNSQINNSLRITLEVLKEKIRLNGCSQTHTRFDQMSDILVNCCRTWLVDHKQDRFSTFILIILEVHNTVILIFVRAIHCIFVLENCYKDDKKR